MTQRQEVVTVIETDKELTKAEQHALFTFIKETMIQALLSRGAHEVGITGRVIGIGHLAAEAVSVDRGMSGGSNVTVRVEPRPRPKEWCDGCTSALARMPIWQGKRPACPTHGSFTVIAPLAGPVCEESDPERPDPPRPKRINYRCSKCGVVEQSGELPSYPALEVYPLPQGWMLVPCPVLAEDDHLHCAVCA